jgi:RHS repeat-associated protein
LTNETITADPEHDNGDASYSLDPVGNRLSDTSSIPDVPSGSYGYNADDEVNTETYDQNGNTLTTSGKVFSYDSENHLTAMNGSAVALVYDGDGNRLAKTVAGVTTTYLVDDLNPTGYPQVVEEMTGGALTRQYTYGLQRISQNQIIDGSWNVSFYSYDGGGNVRALTNSAGVVTDTYSYDAFGNLLSQTGTTPNNYLYRGEQFDPDLGLYYLRARYYNPLTGRFLSRDPLNGLPDDPASLHKYLYGDDDPVGLADPWGRAAASLPLPEPEPEPQKTAGLEYLIILGAIDLTAQYALPPLRNQINCILSAEGSGLRAVAHYLGSPQDLLVSWAMCSAMSSRMPDTTRPGAVPSPIGYPNLEFFTQPGNKWGCGGSAAEDEPTDCSAPCPNGNTETLHFDNGISNGKGAHWDYTDCERKTWYIWPDGMMTPAI